MNTVEIILIVLIVLGAPSVFIYTHFRSLAKGLTIKDNLKWVILLTEDYLTVKYGKKEKRIALSSIDSAFYAYNGNWTESKVVEDALTLKDKNGKNIIKIPSSSEGINKLKEILINRLGKVSEIDVEAAAVLD